jgi:hypothetical protein
MCFVYPHQYVYYTYVDRNVPELQHAPGHSEGLPYQDPRFDYGAVRRAIRPCYNGPWSFKLVLLWAGTIRCQLREGRL